jgi:catechol 2,3-dioxygenase-like lactoylglutathione lyase family enzyme
LEEINPTLHPAVRNVQKITIKSEGVGGSRMKLPVKGVSEIVLEVKDMDQAVYFWSDVLGFPIVDQWKWEPGVPGYQAKQFVSDKHPSVWATWLYVGGNTRLGLWLPRKWTEEEMEIKNKPVTSWPSPQLYDEGGKHVHFALYIEERDFDSTLKKLKSFGIPVTTRQFMPEYRALYFKDPEGNVVEMFTMSMEKSYGYLKDLENKE